MVDVYKNFDFGLLNDADFREDSVREELVVPLLAALGYTASGPDRIVRSKRLEHPFVHIGTRRANIEIIPDYLLQRDGENAWVLDAKGPSERIDTGRNLEQAYSYAIHPAIRVPYYALCNGHDLAVYHISHWDPVLYCPLKDISIEENWNVLLFLFGAESAMPHGIPVGFRQDYGLHVRKIGEAGTLGQAVYYMFAAVPIAHAAKIEDELYCMNSIYGENDEEFMITFDFGLEVYEQFLGALPVDYADRIRTGLGRQPFQISFLPELGPPIGVVAVPGDEVFTNQNESYCPFRVTGFM